MFSFAYGIDDRIEINGKTYKVKLAYDVVLRLIDLLNDHEMTIRFQMETAFKLLFGNEVEIDLSLEEKSNVINEIMKNYVLVEKPSVVFASNNRQSEHEKEYYSLREDADIIFASFFYDYHIDLIDERGKLHWQKFRALLNGLSDKTKLSQVISIRKWKPTDHTSAEEKEQMRELQRFYSLDVNQKDAEELLYFNSLSGEEKEAFARKRLEELGGDKNG